ncbi:maleylpyruvate isomerase family mycothiol-dependent enzyme [Pseudonocardia sp. TRM90224]|uniref:maleylpyruvate isomerase family mycothiol-dependent enzyme n=1 Tax=Pseudonocardia sp. TRM90224 TaxID=2812678 RepID=UPI001E628B2C|nr:maleylpyruvate isomerase family mycothiol-dependent enzyme [Pseudonocardia sp. TRM90224]
MSDVSAGKADPARAKRLADSLAWAGDGAAHLRGLMTRMGGDAFGAPSLLPGWSRAHVLTHIARGADSMINLLTWARTGVRTAAYESVDQRDADIEAGATRPPAAVCDDVITSSDRLAQAVRVMPAEAWAATVENLRGREFPAVEIPWIRAKETWIHSVDLDVGASFSDFPAPMLAALLNDASRVIAGRPGCPSVRLIATDRPMEWVVGDPDVAQPVRGPAAELTAWLLGRSRGKALSTTAGSKLPSVPRWL